MDLYINGYLCEIKDRSCRRDKDSTEPKTIDLIEKEVKNDITKKVQEMFSKFQVFNLDPLGIGS